MINGRVFDWESIRIDTVFGLNLEITNISYNGESPAESVHGRGRAPRGFGRKNLAQEATMDLPAPSVLILDAYAALNGGLFNMGQFPITVSYANNSQVTQIHVLPSCVITRFETEAAQDDAEVDMMKYTMNVLDPIVLNGSSVL